VAHEAGQIVGIARVDDAAPRSAAEAMRRAPLTVEDPGAYTAPWTSGYTLGWVEGAELFEYVCQANNLSPESMGGEGLASTIAP
jgi:hypothetical protein